MFALKSAPKAETPDSLVCPACTAQGKVSTVRWTQVDTDTALFMCENDDCTFPLKELDSVPLVKKSVWKSPATKEILKEFKFPNKKNRPVPYKVLYKSLYLKSLLKPESVVGMLSAEKEWNEFKNRMTTMNITINEQLNNTNDLVPIRTVPDYEKIVIKTIKDKSLRDKLIKKA
jgi:hypothetical protein